MQKQMLSTHLFVRHRLTTVWLERVWDAGFPGVEIFCARQHIDYRNKAQVAELGHWFRDSELKLHSLHVPMYSDDVWGRSGPHATLDITEPSKAKRIETVDEIKRALEIAEVVPFQYAVQHLGVPDAEYDERRVEAAFSSLDELRVFASQRGVELLLENIPNAFSSAERLNGFLAATHLHLNYCFDAGHAHMAGKVEAEFELMKDRIRSTHLHDNDAKADLHLIPRKGSIEWKRIMPLLASRPDQFPLLLELKETSDMEHPVQKAREAMDELVRLSEVDEQ